jgi:hypothetical protein
MALFQGTENVLPVLIRTVYIAQLMILPNVFNVTISLSYGMIDVSLLAQMVTEKMEQLVLNAQRTVKIVMKTDVMNATNHSTSLKELTHV